MEGRLLLSTVPTVDTAVPHKPYLHPFSVALNNPNTPIAPFQTPSKLATFVDPTTKIIHGAHVLSGFKNYIGPYVLLNAKTGFIKIGSGSSILSNAVIQSNPSGQRNPTTTVLIGSNVSIGIGANVSGPSTIGAFAVTSKPTIIGPNAVINGATIQAGAIVGALAKIGPGVTVPSGFRVLPGVDITTNAEASNPALGKVVPVTAGDLNKANQTIANYQALASGYTTLYQGNSATGNFGGGGVVSTTNSNNVYQGNLSAIEGASAEPGSANVSFEPTSGSPTFLAPQGQQQQGLLINFPARVTGAVNFYTKANLVQAALGRHDAILADQGQPFNIGSLGQLGNSVTITSPLGTTSGAVAAGGPISIGLSFSAGDNAVILGAQGVKVVIEDNVSIGAGAVVTGTSIGANSTVGAGSYIEESTLPAGSNIAPGSIIIDNKLVGTVQS